MGTLRRWMCLVNKWLVSVLGNAFDEMIVAEANQTRWVPIQMSNFGMQRLRCSTTNERCHFGLFGGETDFVLVATRAHTTLVTRVTETQNWASLCRGLVWGTLLLEPIKVQLASHQTSLTRFSSEGESIGLDNFSSTQVSKRLCKCGSDMEFNAKFGGGNSSMLSLGAIRGAFDSIQEFGFSAIWSMEICGRVGDNSI